MVIDGGGKLQIGGGGGVGVGGRGIGARGSKLFYSVLWVLE